MAVIGHIFWKQHPIGDGWNVELDPVILFTVGALDSAWRVTSEYIGYAGAGSLHRER
jgi:hypothetical protein